MSSFKQKISTTISRLSEENSWSDAPIHPWRRFFARMLDIVINAFLALGIIILIFGGIAAIYSFFFMEQTEALFLEEKLSAIESFLSGPIGIGLDTILTTFLATLLIALTFGLTGSTIGKGIFGIKIRDAENNKLSMKATFKREMDVYIGGLALGIPIVSFFALAAAHSRLTKKGKTSWDEDGNFTVLYHNSNFKQVFFNIIGFLLFLLLATLMRSI